MTAGVWKPVYLRSYDKILLDGVLFRNKPVTINTTSQATIFGFAEFQIATSSSDYWLEIRDSNN